MNKRATNYLKGRFYAGQITGEELMIKVEAEVRRDVAAEIEQIRGERDETAKELAKTLQAYRDLEFTAKQLVAENQKYRAASLG